MANSSPAKLAAPKLEPDVPSLLGKGTAALTDRPEAIRVLGSFALRAEAGRTVRAADGGRV